MSWPTEGTKFQYRTGALGEGDGYDLCVACDSTVSSEDIRAGVCPECGIRFRATSGECDTLRRKCTVDSCVEMLRRLPPDVLRQVLQQVR